MLRTVRAYSVVVKELKEVILTSEIKLCSHIHTHIYFSMHISIPSCSLCVQIPALLTDELLHLSFWIDFGGTVSLIFPHEPPDMLDCCCFFVWYWLLWLPNS